jgi:hypothetical protein
VLRRAVLALTMLTGVLVPAAAAASSVVTVTSLGVHQPLHAGTRLVSPQARYYATVTSTGRLAVRTAANSTVWATPATAAVAGAYAYIGARGNLVLAAAGQPLWSSRTSGSGPADTLTLTDAGTLRLAAGGLTVWTSRTGNLCHASGVVVDLSRQLMAMCSSTAQLRVTPVTTGATAVGNGTPIGTWHVQAKVRDTTLYPASGGAYPVRYWVPYNAPYGLHDSSWQTFPYGSSRYRTDGSHGCVHVPLRAMTWLFGWLRIGTAVRIHS